VLTGLLALLAGAHLCCRRADDGDAVPGGSCRLWQAWLDHAMFEVRLSAFGVDSTGQRERLVELSTLAAARISIRVWPDFGGGAVRWACA
jgi:hypothetical protein